MAEVENVKPMKDDSINILTIFKIAGAFLAMLIGAGFATGQELMQFFVSEGAKGIAGSFIFLVLGTYMALSLLLTGHKHGFKNGEEVFKHFMGNVIGTVFTWYSIVLMFSLYVVMVAAAGSVLNEAYGLPVYLGSGLMALAVMLALYFGLHELIDVIGVVGPVLIIVILYLAISTLMQNPIEINESVKIVGAPEELRASSSWWLSGILYVMLQLVGLFSVLPVLGAKIESRKDLICAGVLGPVLYFLTLCLTIMAMLCHMPEITDTMIPMLFLAAEVMPAIASVFAFIVLAGIFTTTAPLLWIVLVKFTPDGSRKYKILGVILSLMGYLSGMYLPFDRLVNLIYPTIGYSGMLLIGFMLIKQIKTRSLA